MEGQFLMVTIMVLPGGAMGTEESLSLNSDTGRSSDPVNELGRASLLKEPERAAGRRQSPNR